MQRSLRTIEYRGSKYFTKRDIHICQTILEVRLCLAVDLVQHHLHVRLVATLAKYLYIFCIIETINHRLLDGFVFLIIERIHFHNCIEDLLEILTDLRDWICDNREAVLVMWNVMICDLRRLRRIFHRHLLLLVG